MSLNFRRDLGTQNVDSPEKTQGFTRPIKNEILRSPATEEMVEMKVNLLLLDSETQYIRDKKSFVSSMKKSLKSSANKSNKLQPDDS